MSEQIELKGKHESIAASSEESTSAGCAITQTAKTGWLKGPLGMAICCGAPLLLVAAVSLFGLSLGAIASGFLSLAAVLACPLGMYLMMRMMRNNKK